MKNLTKTIVAVFAIGFVSYALFSQQAQAMPMPSIAGSISFGGSVTFGTGPSPSPSPSTANAAATSPLPTATEVTDWVSSNVTTASGDFSNIPSNTDVPMADTWTFNPSTQTPGLWSLNGFTFDLLSSTIVTQNADLLQITAIGTLSHEGFAPTTAVWTFTSTDPDDTFGFNSTTTAIPDSGSTAALFALAFTGVEALRRKFKAA